MSEVGPAEIRRGDVDGVPVFWTETPPPLRAALMFRVGQTDEDLPWRGLTHPVEHLALAGFAHQTYPYNGFVDRLRTDGRARRRSRAGEERVRGMWRQPGRPGSSVPRRLAAARAGVWVFIAVSLLAFLIVVAALSSSSS